MTKKNKSISLPIITLFITGLSVSPLKAEIVGSMDLHLSGIIDMTVATREEHEVKGVLSGNTSFTRNAIYSVNKASSWSSTIPFVGISNTQNGCNSNGFVTRPDGAGLSRVIPLTNTSGLLGQAYVLPKLRYEIITDRNDKVIKPYYQGVFFESPGNDLSSIASYATNSCFMPAKAYLDIEKGGTKTIKISSPNMHTVYVDKNFAPGAYSYISSLPLYVTSGGWTAEAIGTLRLNISADLTVLRYCEVSNITNARIEHAFINEMESIHNSSLTVQCNGSRQDTLRVVALAKETTYDAQEPTKLLLQPVAQDTKSKVFPWVLGHIYKVGNSSTLSCKDVGNEKLIHFDGREMDLGINVEPNKPMLVNIKWALCRTPEVEPGSYRGKTELSFFVKS